MKKYELVKLLSNDYGAVKKGDYGVVLTVANNTHEVMFFFRLQYWRLCCYID